MASVTALVQAAGPWLAVLGAWLCFGSFAVPMKWKSVVDAQVHPLVYQGYKTFWTFVTAHLVLLFQPYEFTPWGLVSGMLWVPAGVAAVVAVSHVGIAYGQAVWQVTIIATSFVWGFLILKDEAVYSWQGTTLALCCLVFGMLGMTCAFGLSQKRSAEDASELPSDEEAHISFKHNPELEPDPDPEILGMQLPTCSSDHDLSCSPTSKAPKQHASVTERSAVLGLSAALFNGIWGGSNLVPSKYAPFHGTHFVISFATGALVVNAALLLGYALVARLCWQEEMPKFHFKVMALPGFLSGSLWSMGNFLALYCVDKIGQGIGNTLIQSSIIVAGLWGIVFYREMQGKPVLYWSACCGICLLGVLLLAYQRKP